MSDEDKANENTPKVRRDPFALEILTQVQLAEDRHITLRTFAAQEIDEGALNKLLDKIFKATDRSQAFYHKKMLTKHLELHEKRLDEMLKQEQDLLKRLAEKNSGERRKEYKPSPQEEAQQKQFQANIEHVQGEIDATKKAIAECDAKIAAKPTSEK